MNRFCGEKLNWQKNIRDGLMLDGLAGHVAAGRPKTLGKTLACIPRKNCRLAFMKEPT